MKLSERFVAEMWAISVVRFVEESLDESKRSEGFGDDYSFQSKKYVICIIYLPKPRSIPSQL